MIPLSLKLKKELHRNIAAAQDQIVAEMYSVFNNAVMHGGTAIWRCYQGNRFSEDIDVYLQKDETKINMLFSKLEKRGFVVGKKCILENSLYSELVQNRISVRFEALFKRANGILKEYETADGNMITVYTLSPEEFIAEKVDTYLKRLKIRDLYDIFFMLRYTSREKVKEELEKLLKGYKSPIDEKELKALIIEGLVPSPAKMLEYLGR
ncbi:MAG: nucleotidyl transferase AbiEii/AbiGii toxin family protein [Candidatus Woesearchaeota archaeon]